MVFRPATSLLRPAVVHCLLITGGLCSPDVLAGFAAEADASALLQTALPYLLGGLAGLAAGQLFRLPIWRREETVSAPPQPALTTTRWRDFVEVSADWLWETDSELRFIDLPGAPAIPSIAPQDAPGRTWDEVIVPELPADFAIAHKDTLARHGPVAVTLTRRSPTGEIRYLELRGQPLFDASGRFQGYRGIGREVTDQARLANDLERNEERIHALIAYSHDGYWEQDADLRYTAITASSGHLADLAADDRIGTRRWDLPDTTPDAAPWAEHIAHLRQIEPFSNFVFKRLDAQGRPIWLSESGIPVFDRRGVFAGYCGTTRNVTGEIRAREHLQHDEAFFRALFDKAPTNIGSISADNRWLQVNNALATFLGRSVEALVGMPADAMLRTEDAAAGQALRARCMAGEADHFTREVSYRVADGSLRWCRESTRLIAESSGAPPCFVVITEDISAIRETLDSRQAGEERYRQLFELSPEATLVCIGGRIHLVNAASRQLLGATEAHALDGIDMLSLVHPDDRAMESARLQQFEAASHQPILPPLPLRYQRLDGESISAEATGVRIRFEGQPAVLYVLRDVARWLSAEQVLRESRAMYRDVVESVNEILFQTDKEGRVTFFNRAWRHTTGFDSRLSIGQNLLDFVIDEDRVRVEQRLRAIRDGYDEIGQFEFRLRTQSDGPRWVEATIRPLLDTYDHVIGSSGTLDDITARKEAEQSQRNLNRELEARVRVRTAELEASNRELEAFSYSVSHDLRAPLRAINGFSHALAEDYGERLDDTGRNYLERLRKASLRMGELIDELQKLAGVSRHTLRIEHTDVTAIAREILDDLSTTAPERVVHTHVDSDLNADADPTLIRTALENLLGNAWKFSRDSHPTLIQVGGRAHGAEKLFYVTDNGIGFDMAHAGKLFEPFQQLHKRDGFEGSGIGLASVRRIVERHGGSVWAESSPGSGTTVFFTLPRSPAMVRRPRERLQG